MRIELRDGQWAELRERITHGTDKELKRAIQRGKDDPPERFTVDTVLVRAFTRTWHVLDPDGAVILLADADAIDRAPDDIVDKLALAALDLWTGATLTNPETGAPVPNPTPLSSGDSSTDTA
jgi:hypothetical protein